jgi:hypothetical protein
VRCEEHDFNILDIITGTAESGKSTVTKQMKIIHNNGFEMR